MSDSAFPYEQDTLRGKVQHTGLTKREWFAGQALQGLLASMKPGDNSYSINGQKTDVHQAAVQLSDATIKELANGS